MMSSISPREVDEVLLDHPAVVQAVTFAMPHDKLGEEVAAALVLVEDATVSESDIREFARRLAGRCIRTRGVTLARRLRGFALHVRLARGAPRPPELRRVSRAATLAAQEVALELGLLEHPRDGPAVRAVREPHDLVE